MKSKQLMFFTVLDDIEHILQNIESCIEVRYFKTGLHDSNQFCNALTKIPNQGAAISGDWNRVDCYLVMKAGQKLNIREVPQRTGETKYTVDQMANPKSIELKLGGIYRDNIIVAGRIATISEDNDSSELYKLFTSKIKREFRKIGSFYVGRSAEEKLRLGWRLVTNDKSPVEYDLSWS
jgi:hypothetical protein